MAQLVPVDGDPFSAQAAPGLVPVDHDPFSAEPLKKPTGLLQTIDDYMGMAAKGLSFGLADRIGAAGDAAIGRGDYASNLDANRKTITDAEGRHPVGAPVSETLAGIAAPVGAVGAAAKGATLGAKALYGAGAGLGFGALQGAASSPDLTDVGDTAKDAAYGGGLGAAVGGILPVAGAAVGKGIGAALEKYRGGAAGMSPVASQHLINALQADTPAAVQQAASALGPDAMMADLGPSMLGKAQGAVGNSDDARSLLVKALNDRNAGTNIRLNADVNDAFGQAQSPLVYAQGLKSNGKAAASVLPGILDAAGPVDISGVVAGLNRGSQTAVGPEASALAQAKNWLSGPTTPAVEGTPAVPAQRTPIIDPKTGSVIRFNQSPAVPEIPGSPAVTSPLENAPTIHNAKKAFDNVINYGDPGLGIDKSAVADAQGAFKQARGGVNDALREQVPGYADTMDTLSNIMRSRQALKDGRKGPMGIGSSDATMSPSDFNTYWDSLGPDQQDAFRVGTRSLIDKHLGTKANDLQALKNELQGEGGWNAEKLSTIFGDDETSQIVNAVSREAKFRDTYGKVVEGSQTDLRAAARQLMKPAAPTDVPVVNPNMTVLGALGTVVKKYGAQPLWDALMNHDPTKDYGDVARVMTAQGPERDAHISALIDALNRKGKFSAQASAGGNAAALAAGLLGQGAVNERRLRTQPQ